MKKHTFKQCLKFTDETMFTQCNNVNLVVYCIQWSMDDDYVKLIRVYN